MSLSDYQVRDLNDDINKLMGQKYHWERRIKELGGADYTVCILLDLSLAYFCETKLYNLGRDLPLKC